MVRLTAALSVATVLVALLPGAEGRLRLLVELLLLATMLAFTVAAFSARPMATGSRRIILTSLATAASFASAGQALAMTRAMAGAPIPFPSTSDLLFLASHASIMSGIFVALRRVRPMRFGAIVDAMLLVVAALILIVQLDYFTAGAIEPGTGGRLFVILWQGVVAVTLILLALLLAWRGERLGSAAAVGMTLGTVLLAVGSAWHIQVGMSHEAGSSLPAIMLVALAMLGYVLTLPGRRQVNLALTVERPRVESDAATIRAFAIVIAILLASGSSVALGFSAEPQPGAALTIAAFGVLLAVRTAYALWEQRQTTLALETSVIAEREMSATLEQRVIDRTRELADAQRALQRMWTLAQQIALELDRERVIDRFLEAVADVARADGAVIALQLEDRLSVVQVRGIAEVLQGLALQPDSALGRVRESGEPWWTENAQREGLEARPVAEAAVATAIRGMATVPLQRRGERIGAVGIVSRQQRRFTDAEISHVEAMTDLLSLALANVSLVEDMRQAEWRFRTLFRAAPDAVLTILDSGRIKEANEAVREITGLDPSQVVGRCIEELITPEDRERVRFELNETLAGVPARLEARFVHPAGSRVVSLAARRLPQADPSTVLVVGRDMTAEREMRMRLAETERLAAVGELVAGVAHEVNNPLCTISAFAQLMMKDESLNDEQRESVDVIHSETLRASQVLRDLLTFARRSEGIRQPVDINEVVQRTVRLRSYEMEQEGITIELVLAGDLPPVDGDPGQLQQVAINLVTNAIQAMTSSGGALRVVTRVEGEHVVLEVADTGPGMPAEVRARVFEPFFTTKKEGTGLGLSVSYGIVTAMGGSIAVARSGRDGTTFRVTLRRRAPGEGEELAGSAILVARQSPLRGRRLLFVDDEPTLRTGMMAFGRLRRINVVTAEDGGAALQAARIGDFDAVVCDLRMPGIDGATFWEMLRQERPELAARTLFITGDVVSPGSRAFLESTSQPVLTKPFEFAQLEEAIGELMRAEAA